MSSNINDSKINDPWVLLSITVGAVFVLLWWSSALDNPFINLDVMINYELASADYTSILTTFFFVALIAERFVEVLIGASRKAGRQKFEIAIANEAALEIKKQLEIDLSEYRAETAKQAVRISYVIGIFIAIAGFRVLNALVDTQVPNDVLFNAVDIILTGGLIAGGSKGVNGITSLMDSYVNRAKTPIEGGPQPPPEPTPAPTIK